jgi:MoaA/NifB/PqqE/SkfB family radical SAM enzyme
MNRTTVACTTPFTFLQINPRGDLYLCCPAWTTAGPVGRITETTTIEDIWNNAKSREIRRAILEGRMDAVCNRKYCPIAASGKPCRLTATDPVYRSAYAEIRAGHTVMDTLPRTLILAHSGRCNLRCIMCCSHEGLTPEEPRLNDLIFNRELPRLLPHLHEIVLNGDGDPFFMKDTREFLQKFAARRYPNIRFSIITNGMMLNEAMWKSLRHNSYNWISVSVDAATKPTYETIRRGGNWEILRQNLKLISRLRKNGAFTSFALSFVVMKSNYREMADFVRMAINLGADRVDFQKIFGWSAVGENINLTHDTAVMKDIGNLLSDPVFTHPIVNAGLLSDYRRYDGMTVTPIDRAYTAGRTAAARSLSRLRTLAHHLK